MRSWIRLRRPRHWAPTMILVVTLVVALATAYGLSATIEVARARREAQVAAEAFLYLQQHRLEAMAERPPTLASPDGTTSVRNRAAARARTPSAPHR